MVVDLAPISREVMAESLTFWGADTLSVPQRPLNG